MLDQDLVNEEYTAVDRTGFGIFTESSIESGKTSRGQRSKLNLHSSYLKSAKYTNSKLNIIYVFVLSLTLYISYFYGMTMI